MSEEIKVHVNKWGQGRKLLMYYIDPITGKQVSRTTGTTKPKDAERMAAVWEDELNTGRYKQPSKVTWAEFRERYEEEKLSAQSEKTFEAMTSAFNHLERVLNPDRLAKLTTAVMSDFQARLRKPRQVQKGNEIVTIPGMKDTTIAAHLRHLKAALNWAAKMGLMHAAPKIEMPRRSKGKKLMKGRPITTEEFERMLGVIPKVRPEDSDAWTQYLNGLWLSGLRLEESLALSWDEESPFSIDLSGRKPRFRIHGSAQKSGQDEMLPLTPDFADWLLKTPEDKRHGRVFNLNGLSGGGQISTTRVGRLVSKIGRKAKVIVNKTEGKYASAHDLRRAFGTRWAKLVMPAVLQRLMRHASIDTTMGYYVDLDSDDVSDVLDKVYRPTVADTNSFPNNVQKTPRNAEGALSVAPDETPCDNSR